MFFRHCDKATLEPQQGLVTGIVPDWLEGTFTRNGGGVREVGEDKYLHLFDGLAILHRFHISNGKVTYNSRPLHSDAYNRAQAAQRIIMTEFGTLGMEDPCDKIFKRFKTLFEPRKLDESMTDNCVANVGYYGDELYAMSETAFLRRIDPVTLEVIGNKQRIGDYVAVNQATAHPHVLPDGTLLNLGSNFRHIKGPHYCVIKIPPASREFDANENITPKQEFSVSPYKNAKIVAEIPASSPLYPSYYHSFALIGDKIVFIEQPFCISVTKVLLSMTVWRTPFKEWLEWIPNKRTKFHVVNWKTGEVYPTTFETKNLFTFHHVNAFEENGTLIVDVVGYNDALFVTRASADNFASEYFNNMELRRYKLPLQHNSSWHIENKSLVEIEAQVLSKFGFEFPRINYRFNGLKYKFAYGASSGLGASEPNEIVKVNVVSGGALRWSGGKDVMVSEPVFVARPLDGADWNLAEDDGVVLTALMHKKHPCRATLVIIDARDMREIFRAVFEAHGVVTAAFHGQWAQHGVKVHSY